MRRIWYLYTVSMEYSFDGEEWINIESCLGRYLTKQDCMTAAFVYMKSSEYDEEDTQVVCREKLEPISL